MSTKPRWYLSAAAIRDYLRLRGRPDDDGGPEWGRAERELSDLCDRAHLVDTEGERQRWRTGRPERYTLIVSTAQRSEGDLPQLVAVHGGARRAKR